MCGIVAYLGKKEVYPILIKGLKRLEYRGYDSAGIALYNDDINIYKIAGKVSDLENHCDGKNINGVIGIGHTRWATHGVPNDTNAHPHLSDSGDIAIIHNGIIENYASIKAELIEEGHTFHSDTDTEVLVHLIEQIKIKEKVNIDEAVRLALNEVIGAYAIVVIDKNESGKLVAARKGSPLVIGIGKEEFYLASDASPIIEYTKSVVYLNDLEVATMTLDGVLQIKTIENKAKTPYIQELELKLEAIEKGGYEHFMLKEIHEQPVSIENALRGRLIAEKGVLKLGGFDEFESKIANAKRIVVVACGTSWHAGIVGEYIIEELARVPVEVEYASEFRYRNPIINEDDFVIAISQSGETADTLAALELAKEKGATIFGICNVVGSSIARITHAGAYIHAGPEIGVASTKAFTGQVSILLLFALSLARKKGTISEEKLQKLMNELENIPSKVKELLKVDDKVREIATHFKDASNCLYLGRGSNFPVALEGALKLKEISYIHAEGYPAAEMKHGPIALIDEEMPVVVLATNKSAHEKMVSNIQEVKARKGKIFAIITEGDEVIKPLADHYIEIPESDEVLMPLLTVIPLQLLSYHVAIMRGCNVDQPRNLAKSVTVE